MYYQVLARKWRPGSFEDFVGQTTVVRALKNAFEQKRLHHAYLFSGTRGVGKTTLGRILAKCFSCENGPTAEPCRHCPSCRAIAEGCFVDLLEIDAASRTKVEDTRALLENMVYPPTMGRYKIYLIDEVHMLSTHSFNALLKTLEEPPPHILFIFATTDPEKIPVTVLSRCLHFPLKKIAVSDITTQLTHILTEEKIPFESAALSLIANAADGSLRDALSLLDQAIAYTHQTIQTTDVREMLGYLEPVHYGDLLETLVDQDGTRILDLIERIAEKQSDFSAVLEQFLEWLYQVIRWRYAKPTSSMTTDQTRQYQFSQTISPEDLQLYYQIGLMGRKDLPYAPSTRIGFEITLLRMLAFQCDDTVILSKTEISTTEKTISPTLTAETWPAFINALSLSGPLKVLAAHTAFKSFELDQLHLQLDPTAKPLLTTQSQQGLQAAIANTLQQPIRLQINIEVAQAQTPLEAHHQGITEKKNALTKNIEKNPGIESLKTTFSATLIPGSIQLNDD